MFKLNFISEENSNIYYAQNGGFAVNELPETKIEDGFEVYIDDDEYLELNEYLSEGNDAEVVINWSTEIDYDTKTITINGEIEEEYEDWGYSFDVYDIESALRDITDKFNITWKEASLLDEDGEEQW